MVEEVKEYRQTCDICGKEMHYGNDDYGYSHVLSNRLVMPIRRDKRTGSISPTRFDACRECQRELCEFLEERYWIEFEMTEYGDKVTIRKK